MTNPTTITRSVPDIGYLDPTLFDDLGIVQTIVANGTVYVSGIAPLTDGSGELDVVSTSLAEQLEYVLGVLERSLAAVGVGRDGLVAWTIYTTDVPALAACTPLLKDWVGDHRPTSTWIGCSGFIHPQQLLELTATAVVA
ncbi:Rid family hydrolase [Mycolicibacterium sp. 120266]|jgi:enamine deaminase RidA (YjgF/YER057c/UK114 family)|uniref:RidA family protein n=1 Tax=Mycolicibacterium sp. 120266 TaxID=3090601 RepID=UPI00299DFB00|nr:Rid family hydrolase [Mycolicibacterium sp. 120266]MDX1875288.1 Rid family hydrolase [Mycolicibacterium sp. 120266]